jgi:hypothetical protein
MRRTSLLGCALAGALAGAPRPATAVEPQAEVPLDRFFHGAVVGLKGSTVRLRYDFSDPAQMKDWTKDKPFPITPDPADAAELLEGRLAVRGSTGARHVAEWEGDLVVTARLIPEATKDVGAFLSTPDAPTDYVVYTVVETYFNGWDKRAGGDTGMIKFGKQWATVGGGFNGFRYMTAKRLQPDPAPGKPLAFTFGRKGGKDVMAVGPDLEIDAVEPGNPMKVVQAGFYAIKGSMTVDDVVLEGRPSPRWLARNKVVLRTEKPIVAEVESTGVDPAVAAMVEAYAKGTEKSPQGLFSVAGDAARSEADRRAAAGALKAGPRRILGIMGDLLYSKDTLARTLGIDIVKSMTGKTYGYDPKAGEGARNAAIKRFNEDLKSHPELKEGGGG